MIERTDPVNWSTLKAMRVSPRHYIHGLTNPRTDTEALLLGRLTHCMVYEADAVSSRYACEPSFHRGMNDENAIAKGYEGGKQAAALFESMSAGREVVKPDLWARAKAMSVALHADEQAGPMVRGGFAEQLVTWTDKATGIECRGRIDHINGRLSDLKTARSIDPRLFASQAVRLGYHAQLAYYADGLVANGVVLQELPAIIAVENEAPYDVAVFQFELQDLAAGRAEYRRCLDRLAECRATGLWPGVSGGAVVRIALPEWVLASDEDDEFTPMSGGVKMF